MLEGIIKGTLKKDESAFLFTAVVLGSYTFVPLSLVQQDAEKYLWYKNDSWVTHSKFCIQKADYFFNLLCFHRFKFIICEISEFHKRTFSFIWFCYASLGLEPLCSGKADLIIFISIIHVSKP
jgi:hypothetical protein